MTNQSSSRKIVKNSITGVIRVFIVTPILFIIVPFTLLKLGKELYGVWALGSAVTSFAQLSDMGLGKAVIRFVAQYSKISDHKAINEVVNTTLMAYLLIAFLVLLLIAPNINWIVINIFNIPSNLTGDASIVIIGALIIFAANLMMGIFTNILDGFQRMDLSNIADTLSVLLQSGGTFIALSIGWGLKGLIVANIFAILITGVIALIMVKKFFPPFGLHPRYIRFEMLKTTLGYSLQVQAASIISLAYDPFNRLLITNLCGLSFLAYYDIANRLIANVRSIFLSAINPLFPAAAELSTGGLDKERLNRIHYHSERYLLLTAPIIMFLSMAIMPGFIFLWIGNGYALTGVTYQVVGIGFSFSLVATPAFIMFAGMGRPKFQIYGQLILTILNVTLGFFLGHLIGYIGIIIANAAALTISSIFFLGSFARLTNGGFKIFPLRSGIISIVTAAAISILIYFSLTILPLNYIVIIAIAFVGMVAYIAAIIKAHILNASDTIILETLKIKKLVAKLFPEILVD